MPTLTFDLLTSNTDPEPNSGTLVPDPDSHQNVFDWSLGQVSPLPKISSKIEIRLDPDYDPDSGILDPNPDRIAIKI